MHLAHPLGVKMFSYRRVKTNATPPIWPICCGWASYPRRGSPQPAARELRGWVRHRAKLVGLRSGLKCQVHAVLAAAGVQVPLSDLFGERGQQLLTTARLAPESRARVESVLRLITAFDFEIDLYAELVAGRMRTHPGYRAIQQIPGVGPVLAAVFVAEIGDITRFHRPQQLASWAGLTRNTASPTPRSCRSTSCRKAKE